jgi:transmembrane sensor
MDGSTALDELIIRVLDGTANAEEADRVAVWMNESPENRQRYEAVELVWNETEPEPVTADVDLSVVPRIVSAAREREAARRRRPAHVLRWALPLAASIGAISFGVWQWTRDTTPRDVFVAPATASATFVLSDGSFVRLAAGARLQHVASPDERRYELEGRALFAVTHDENNPFSVSAGGIDTRVLGTRFDVRELPDGSRQVAVLEGRVEVTSSDGGLELSAGELSLVAPGGSLTKRSVENVGELLDWAEGTLLFKNTPLDQAAREVSWFFGARVIVEGENLRNMRISAWYGSEPFRDVVQSLCAATGAECTVSDSLAVIR